MQARMKAIIELIKDDIINKEMTFCELDDIMCDRGFYSEFDEDERVSDAKRSNSLYYLYKGDDETKVKIKFLITANNEVDEIIQCFDLIAYSVELM